MQSLTAWYITVIIILVQPKVWSPQASISWLHTQVILSSLGHSSRQSLRLRFIWKFSFFSLFLESCLLMSSKVLLAASWWCHLLICWTKMIKLCLPLCLWFFHDKCWGKICKEKNQTYLPRLNHGHMFRRYHQHISGKTKNGRWVTFPVAKKGWDRCW